MSELLGGDRHGDGKYAMDCTCFSAANQTPVVVPTASRTADRIDAIICEAASTPGGKWHRYEAAKAKLSKLVGWHAIDPEFRSSLAYELAIRRLESAIDRRPRG